MARSTGWMRTADQVVGPIILRMLAARHKAKRLPDNPARIGVILPTAIGDTILSSGVLCAMAEKYPAAELFVFHGHNNSAAVRLLPVPVEPILCPFTNPIRTVTSLRREHIDLLVDLTPWTKLTAIYARLGAPVAIGFDPPGQNRGRAFDIAVPHRRDAHEIDNHAAVAALFSDRPYEMSIKTQPFTATKGLIFEKLVLVHTSAGGARAADKAWPADNWVELTRQLAAAGWQVGMIGAAADKPLVETILTRAVLSSASAVSLCGMVPLAQLGDLLQRARLLITIDTGILHLGAAVDARILALHGPTRSSRWGARNANATSLDSAHAAAGYICYGYEWHPDGHEIMSTHSVASVLGAALGLLCRPGQLSAELSDH